MFKTLKLAADARRAKRILGDLGLQGGHCDTLAEQAEVAVGIIENFRRSSAAISARAIKAEAELRDANAKIERMTSGLKRGSKQPA